MTTRTHYEILGVATDATPEQIKQAFRKARSEAHPDREGGSDDLAAAVNLAFEVLSDPARRKRYDESGESRIEPPLDVEARDLLLKVLAHAIDSGEENPVAAADRTLRENLQRVQSQVNDAIAKMRQLRTQRKRVKVRGDGLNLVHALIDDKSRELRAKLPDMKAFAATLKHAQEILDRHEYEPPPEAESPSTGGATNFARVPQFVMFKPETLFGTASTGGPR